MKGRPLVANIDYREPGANGVLHLTLFDPETSKDGTQSINAELVRDGLATVDSKSRLASAYPVVVKALNAASAEAHRSRAGESRFAGCPMLFTDSRSQECTSTAISAKTNRPLAAFKLDYKHQNLHAFRCPSP